MAKESCGCNAESIREELIALFSMDKIFYNCSVELIERFKVLYKKCKIQKLLEDSEIIDTVNLLFKNNLNISLTSKEGYMHRNTLIYRLDKIKGMIGLDVRNFNDAVVFVNFLLFHQMFKNKM